MIQQRAALNEPATKQSSAVGEAKLAQPNVDISIFLELKAALLMQLGGHQQVRMAFERAIGKYQDPR